MNDVEALLEMEPNDDVFVSRCRASLTYLGRRTKVSRGPNYYPAGLWRFIFTPAYKILSIKPGTAPPRPLRCTPPGVGSAPIHGACARSGATPEAPVVVTRAMLRVVPRRRESAVRGFAEGAVCATIWRKIKPLPTNGQNGQKDKRPGLLRWQLRTQLRMTPVHDASAPDMNDPGRSPQYAFQDSPDHPQHRVHDERWW